MCTYNIQRKYMSTSMIFLFIDCNERPWKAWTSPFLLKPSYKNRWMIQSSTKWLRMWPSMCPSEIENEKGKAFTYATVCAILVFLSPSKAISNRRWRIHTQPLDCDVVFAETHKLAAQFRPNPLTIIIKWDWFMFVLTLLKWKFKLKISYRQHNVLIIARIQNILCDPRSAFSLNRNLKT